MLVTSKNVLFPGHNWCLGDNQSVGSSVPVVSRWLGHENRALEVVDMVVSWWIVYIDVTLLATIHTSLIVQWARATRPANILHDPKVMGSNFGQGKAQSALSFTLFEWKYLSTKCFFILCWKCIAYAIWNTTALIFHGKLTKEITSEVELLMFLPWSNLRQ